MLSESSQLAAVSYSFTEAKDLRIGEEEQAHPFQWCLLPRVIYCVCSPSSYYQCNTIESGDAHILSGLVWWRKIPKSETHNSKQVVSTSALALRTDMLYVIYWTVNLHDLMPKDMPPLSSNTVCFSNILDNISRQGADALGMCGNRSYQGRHILTQSGGVTI